MELRPAKTGLLPGDDAAGMDSRLLFPMDEAPGRTPRAEERLFLFEEEEEGPSPSEEGEKDTVSRLEFAEVKI